MPTLNIEAAIAKAEAAMLASRAYLVQYEPFTGNLSLGLKLRADLTCNTAWTDGRSIGYSPKFVNGLLAEHVIGLLYHEVLHVALGHPWRRETREFRKWNIACDKVVNYLLLQAGFKLPPNCYVAEGEEIGKSAEWIYAHMPDEQPEDEQPEDEQPEDEQPEPGKSDDQDEDEQKDGDGEAGNPGDSGDDESDDESGDGDGDGDSEQDGTGDGTGKGKGKGDGDGDGQGQGTGDFGEVRDAPEGEDEDGDAAPTETDMQQRVARAATYARMQGNYPANLADEITEALKPRIDVRSILLRFCQENCRADYDWMRPNKRYLSQRIYLPARHSKRLREVALYVDTSASMDVIALRKAQGIVQSVIEEVQPDVTSVWYADTRVARADRFERGETLIWNPVGRGGTDFRPAFAAIDAEGTAKVIVCITDMDGSYPDMPPSAPVIWLNVSRWSDDVAPFGETIKVPAE